MTDTATLLDEIGARICGGKNTKAFNLLYKCIDKTDVDEFHVACDAKGPTVTILYGKHNTLFGGYTSKDWSSNKNRKVKDKDAFLFTKKNHPGAKCFFLPIKKKKTAFAITCDVNFGPTFGGGKFGNYDLQAFKRGSKTHCDETGNIHLNGSLNVRSAYDVERAPMDDGSNQGLDKTENIEQKVIKTDDINSGLMIVKRIEVYQVVDDELPVNWLPKLEKEEFIRKKEKLMEMEPLPGIDIKQYNILLVGEIGSGKSSLYNTLASVFSRKVSQIAPTRCSLTSVTSSVKAYFLKSEMSQELNIRIFDIRGFEEERGYDHEIEHLLDGKLPNDFPFSDKSEPVKKDILTKQTLDNEIHLVCFVNGNPYVDTIPDELRKRIEDIKKAIAKKGLPMVVVATKFDKLCPKISEEVDQIYTSPKAKEAASKIAGLYGVPFNDVYPVVNYVSEKETNEGIERLALNALYEMYELIESYLGNHKDFSVKQDDWAKRKILLPTWKNGDEKAVTMRQLGDELSELEEQKLRVLIVGPTNSGKSSFVDSVSSALRDDICTKAVGGCTASAQCEGFSSTEQFHVYPLKYKHHSGRLRNSNVYFGDTPGFQETGGITVQEVKKKLGHVRSMHKKVSVDDKDGIKTHCLVAVFDCVAVLNGLSEKHKTMMQEILSFVRAEGIPYIVILTKCDVISKAVKENKQRVFEDRTVKECKNRLMEIFRFKQKIIFPVVNYVEENTVDLQADTLLTAAFNEILMNGKEILEESNEKGDNWQTET